MDRRARSVNTGQRKLRRPILMMVVNVAWYFNLHRLALARAAFAAGFEVHVVTAPDKPQDAEQIERAGLIYHPLNIQRGRFRPLQDVLIAWRLYRLYRRIRPDVVHHITIKPVLFGTLAARMARAPAVVNSMSGLGFVFTGLDRIAAVRRACVLMAYRLLFASRRVRVIFENRDDMQMFIEKRIASPSRAQVIRGVGVDMARYDAEKTPQTLPLVILPGRMLWDKGVREFCEAARTLKMQGVNARFALVGPLDPDNPAAIPQSWLEEQQASGVVEWWGGRADMTAVYAQTSIVCLPTYREGLPTVLVEAAASRCAVVATDVPGCREIVAHERTGLLVPARDAPALSRALKRLIEDPELRTRCVGAAYAFVTAELSEEKISAQALSVYQQMLSPGMS